MKCEIIRDLLPSYIDELTSGESNREIEGHLKTCPGCRRYLDEMREGIEGSAQLEKNKREIQPFRKIKRSIWKAVGLTALVCVLIFGIYSWYYTRAWKVDSSDVKVTYEKVGGVVTLGFLPKDENIYIEVERESKNPDKIVVYAKHVSPLQKPLRKGGYYGYTFVDENTILKEDGTKAQLTGEETLTIVYGDKTEKRTVQELFDGTDLP